VTAPEDRFHAATAAIAEREHLVRVRDILAHDVDNEQRRVTQLVAQLQFEKADVTRLTTGVMGFIETILAADGQLEKEKAEVLEAQARLADAEHYLDSLRSQVTNINARIAQLDPAQLAAELAAARTAREEALVRSNTPAGAALQDIAIRIESIDIELVPLADAVAAGEAAFQALAKIIGTLDAVAANQVVFGSKPAESLAGDAQGKLVGFHRALGDIASASFDDRPDLDPSDTAFADAWVKGLFAKGTREERIAAARAPMVARIERVGAIMTPLRTRRDEIAARRLALVDERAKLLG
jgi:hypothetical protein